MKLNWFRDTTRHAGLLPCAGLVREIDFCLAIENPEGDEMFIIAQNVLPVISLVDLHDAGD